MTTPPDIRLQGLLTLLDQFVAGWQLTPRQKDLLVLAKSQVSELTALELRKVAPRELTPSEIKAHVKHMLDHPELRPTKRPKPQVAHKREPSLVDEFMANLSLPERLTFIKEQRGKK